MFSEFGPFSDIFDRSEESPLMAEDNWVHRSAGMRCQTCMWYVQKTRMHDNSGGESELPTGVGRCRRRSPTLSGWPAMYDSDWCGDHKIDEEKL